MSPNPEQQRPQEKPKDHEVSGKLKAATPTQAEDIEALERAGQKKIEQAKAQPNKHPFDAQVAKAEKPVTLQPRTMEEARNWLKAQKVLIDSGMDPSKEFLALIGLKKPTDDPLFSFGKEKITAAVKALQKEVRAVDDGVFGRATYLAVLNKYPDKYADARFAALGAKSETKIVAESGRRKEREVVDLDALGYDPPSLLAAAAEKHGGPKVKPTKLEYAKTTDQEVKRARADFKSAQEASLKINKNLEFAKKDLEGTRVSNPTAIPFYQKKVEELTEQYVTATKREAEVRKTLLAAREKQKKDTGGAAAAVDGK